MFLPAPIHLYVPFLNFVNINRDSTEVSRSQPTLLHQRDQTGGQIWPVAIASSSVTVLKKITQKLKIWKKEKKPENVEFWNKIKIPSLI